MNEMLGGIGIFGTLFLVALGLLLFLLWFLLPFAVFGIKERLDKQIKEQQKTNQLLITLTELNKELVAKKNEQVNEK